MSFHRDEANGDRDGDDDEEKQEFSFEEPAIDGNQEHSLEDEEEKSLINALDFKK